MANASVLLQHFYLIFILFKHWFYSLLTLLRGGVPLKDISSETVLITGAASGLGKGLAERLARMGCKLVLWDVDAKSNERLAEELNQMTNSKRVHAMKCDLSKREEIYSCAKKVQSTIGDVTMVINNAGVVSGKLMLNCSDESIQRTFDVNVLAHFWIIRAFLPAMVEKNSGHIVTIASAAGLVGAAGLVDYCSSKFAAVGLHESLTHELYAMNKRGIRTTVICPSYINTGMFQGAKTSDIVPLLDANNVCDLIIEAIRKNQNMLLIPKSFGLSLVLGRLSPIAADLESQDYAGMHHSMDTFVGRSGKSS